MVTNKQEYALIEYCPAKAANKRSFKIWFILAIWLYYKCWLYSPSFMRKIIL